MRFSYDDRHLKALGGLFLFWCVFVFKTFCKKNLVGDVIGVKGLYTCENASLERFEEEMYTMWFAKIMKRWLRLILVSNVTDIFFVLIRFRNYIYSLNE